MGAVSRKLRSTTTGYAHWCPACNSMHDIKLRGPFVQPPSWSFNQNVEHPTFDPSINYHHPASGDVPEFRCHYFLKDGYLHYCPDSTHALRGLTVELPDLPYYLQIANAT